MWTIELGDFDFKFPLSNISPLFFSYKMDDTAVKLKRIKINLKEKLTCSFYKFMLRCTIFLVQNPTPKKPGGLVD